MRTATFLLFPLLIASASAQVGIASHYPGDRGINYDPDVLVADDFESYTSPSQLADKWSKLKGVQYMTIATGAGNFYSGSKAIELTLPIGTDIGTSVHKDFAPGKEQLYIRAYFKYATDYYCRGSNHNGLGIQGNYPEGQPGIKPAADGTDFFLFLLQNNIQNKPRIGETDPGYSNFYSYWPKQRSNYGDHWYPNGLVTPYSYATGADGHVIGNRGDWLAYPAQYPGFNPMPQLNVPRGQWFCYEEMVKLNTIGKNDGEVAFWYNGQLAGRFTNLFIRGRSTLLIDRTGFGNQANKTTQVLRKWVDNVVIAKKYIGPMTPLR